MHVVMLNCRVWRCEDWTPEMWTTSHGRCQVSLPQLCVSFGHFDWSGQLCRQQKWERKSLFSV